MRCLPLLTLIALFGTPASADSQTGPTPAPTYAPGETSILPPGFNGLAWGAALPKGMFPAPARFQIDPEMAVYLHPSDPKSFHGVPIAGATYVFFERRLREVVLFLDPLGFQEALTALVRAWGPADSATPGMAGWYTPTDSTIAYLMPGSHGAPARLRLFDGRFALERVKAKGSYHSK